MNGSGEWVSAAFKDGLLNACIVLRAQIAYRASAAVHALCFVRQIARHGLLYSDAYTYIYAR